jgi:hypothetical protein
MGYSTFRHFLKEQFPNLRFQKDENPTKSAEPTTIQETATAGNVKAKTAKTQMNKPSFF